MKELKITSDLQVDRQRYVKRKDINMRMGCCIE